MRIANTIVFASTNRHKYFEFKEWFKKYPALNLILAEELLSNPEKIGLVENGETYEENSAAKARVANHGCHYPCLADDTGLEIDALGGRPGVRSHRFALAKAGISQDQANRDKVLEELRGVPVEKRRARFVTCVSLVTEGMLISARGVLEGKIAEAPIGKNGFGYDPIFIPEGSTRTLSEMSDAEKNRLSHRSRAIDALMEELQIKGIILAKP